MMMLIWRGSGERIGFSIKDAESNRISKQGKKAYLDLSLTSVTKIDSRWTADLHVKGELIKL